VAATDLAPDALPLNGPGVDEGQLDIVAGYTGLLAAGDTRLAQADLEAGTYVLFCNVPGHYGAGMFTSFEVTSP
jgi:uncharacterized cupredoxin-like copper-binding protein